MTPTEIANQVKSRTKHPSFTKIAEELQSAYRWALRRVFNTENGPDLLVTIDEELTMNSRAVELDLVAALSGRFLGIKQLWLQLPGETTFTPMAHADTNDAAFIAYDNDPSTSVVATGHPVLYDSINFGSVRFAPALPSGSVVRVDYWGFGEPLDTDESDSASGGPEIARAFEVIEDAVLNKTTALVFTLLDDDRDVKYEARAESDLRDAIWVLNRRVQRPTRTTPYRVRGRRFLL